MAFEQRKRDILRLLTQKEFVEVVELSEKLGVSDITVRRDLAVLEKENLLLRTHGGAARMEENPIVRFKTKSSKNQSAKELIGKKAAQKIKEGDVIFIDCGSTTFQICSHILNIKIKVITNSLPVVHALKDSLAEINLIGGELDKKRQAIHGKMAVQHISQYHADKAFIGVDAISAAYGLSANSEKEAEITRAIIDQSKKVFVLADKSKVGKRAYLKFADYMEVDDLISSK